MTKSSSTNTEKGQHSHWIVSSPENQIELTFFPSFLICPSTRSSHLLSYRPSLWCSGMWISTLVLRKISIVREHILSARHMGLHFWCEWKIREINIQSIIHQFVLLCCIVLVCHLSPYASLCVCVCVLGWNMSCHDVTFRHACEHSAPIHTPVCDVALWELGVFLSARQHAARSVVRFSHCSVRLQQPPRTPVEHGYGWMFRAPTIGGCRQSEWFSWKCRSFASKSLRALPIVSNADKDLFDIECWQKGDEKYVLKKTLKKNTTIKPTRYALFTRVKGRHKNNVALFRQPSWPIRTTERETQKVLALQWTYALTHIWTKNIRDTQNMHNSSDRKCKQKRSILFYCPLLHDGCSERALHASCIFAAVLDAWCVYAAVRTVQTALSCINESVNLVFLSTHLPESHPHRHFSCTTVECFSRTLWRIMINWSM